MKTGNLGNVAVSTPELKRSPFPWSKNAYTTCGFGEVQPLKCQWCDSDSVNNFSVENLTYLGDLVSPTYGKVNVEFWHYFVSMRDMFENFDRFLAKTPSQSGRNPNMQRYLDLPHISAGVLSLLPLVGAHCTAYKVTQDFESNRAVQLPVWKFEDTASQTAAAGEFSSLQNAVWGAVKNWMALSTGGSVLNVLPNNKRQTKIMPFPTMCLDIRCLLPSDVSSEMRLLSTNPFDYCWLPLSNPDWASFFEVQDANGATVLTQEGVDIAPVSLQEGGYDFMIEIGGGSVDRWILAFRMHAFGRRLHKILTGCNFTIDVSSTESVSLMPLLAVWKAYFDCFGLTLYENFDMTPVGRLLKFYNSACFTLSMDVLFGSRDNAGDIVDTGDMRLVANLGASIIRDLGSMWYTDSQDYVSMQQRSPTVAITMDDAFINRLNPVPVGPNGTTDVTLVDNSVTVPLSYGHEQGVGSGVALHSSHAYIDKVVHGQFDANVIKMLYLQTNNSTIAGKRLEKILRAMGYGKWLEHQKPRFIGHDVIEIDFNQVISTANTEDGAKGSGVGARGGRGQGYGQCKTHKYHNDEAGFLITLCSVVPHSGYSQGLNPAFRLVKPEDVYTPLIDGLSMEATEVRDICGDRPVVLLTADGHHRTNETSRTFGFAPQCSRLKREQNTYSGGFARKSKRDYFLTFCLDKFIDVGATALMSQDATPQRADNGLLHRDATFTQIFAPEDFALSGNHWRYPTRYPWLGNFNRIFAMLGDDQQNYYGVINNATNLFSYWEYFNNEDDGFIVMCVINQKNNMRKKPISDSFETFDEENPISTNISKA